MDITRPHVVEINPELSSIATLVVHCAALGRKAQPLINYGHENSWQFALGGCCVASVNVTSCKSCPWWHKYIFKFLSLVKLSWHPSAKKSDNFFIVWCAVAKCFLCVETLFSLHNFHWIVKCLWHVTWRLNCETGACKSRCFVCLLGIWGVKGYHTHKMNIVQFSLFVWSESLQWKT